MNTRTQLSNKIKLILPDKVIISITLLLTICGLILIYDSSLYAANSNFQGDTFRLVILQAKWLVVGIIAFSITTYLISYKQYKKFTLSLFIATVILLIFTLLTAHADQQNGAKRWISLANFSVQGSEIAKLTFILYLASWFSKQGKYSNFNQFVKQNMIPFGIILLLVVGLVAAGKDLSTAFILALIGIVMYFFSIKNKEYLKAFIFLTIVILILGSILTLTEGFRVGRFQTFFDINQGHKLSASELSGPGYQINQSLIGVGSGGLLGKGFTNSIVKYSLPETVSATDSIFSVYAEEFGFVGSVILVLAYLFLIIRILKLIDKTQDSYAQLILIGIVTWIGSQAFINISANIALIPVSGVTLPLISYGGSSLLMILIALGIVCNISRYQNISPLNIKKSVKMQKSSMNSQRSKLQKKHG